MLGIMAAVGLYFWTPLMLKWVGWKDGSPSATASAVKPVPNAGPASPATTTPAPAAAGSPDTEKPKPPEYRPPPWCDRCGGWRKTR